MTAPSPQRATIGVALLAVSRDALRRPLFYAARVPRLPVLLSREGLNDLLVRVAQHAQTRDAGAGQKFWLRQMILRIWSLISWGRVEQRGHR